MISAKPFLLCEIAKSKKSSSESSIIGDYKDVSDVYTYGFVKRKFEGEEHPNRDENKWVRPPSIVITDENAESDVLIRPKPWDTAIIKVIESCNANDLVIVKGKFNWYESKEKEVMNINILSLSLISPEYLNGYRNLFLAKMARVRIGDKFEKNSYLYGFLSSSGVPIKDDNENEFHIEPPIESEVITIAPKKIEKKAAKIEKKTTSKIVVAEDERDFIDDELELPKKKSESQKARVPSHREESDVKVPQIQDNPQKEVEKESEEKKITYNDVSEFIKLKKKVSLKEIEEHFSIDSSAAWVFCVNSKKNSNGKIKVIDTKDDTYMTYGGD